MTARATPEPMVGGLLRLLSETLRDQILSDVSERGYRDITRAHLSVFQFPSPEGVSPSLLAARARMTKQSMNYLLRELEDRGYLGRRDTPGDGRSRIVFLTPRGKRLVQEMRKSVREVENEWRQILGRDRFADVKDALVEVFRSVTSEGRVT